MKFVVITHVVHKKVGSNFQAYAPYVLEMNRWFNYVDAVKIVAPANIDYASKIAAAYQHKQLDFVEVPQFSLLSVRSVFTTLLKLPIISYTIWKSMKWADHIHLRCPGNMGLLGSMIQVFFPSKAKTVKYAGNWDPNSKQPWSYKLQKWIISNTFLSKNMKVLVYGDWPEQTKNIKSFFTASFSENECVHIDDKIIENQVRFIFVGSLVEGKRPLEAIKIVQSLKLKGINAVLELYGEGSLKESLQSYIIENNLSDIIKLCGVIPLELLKRKYQEAHFSILPSKSEGWPKAVAEAMFFNCVPIATPVSCVPWMLNYGKRGIVMDQNFDKNIAKIDGVIKDPLVYNDMAKEAGDWSRTYTLEYFEAEIYKLL
ncbi:glycosyltransferase family 4 protein [Zunongwangia sp. HRR-M8]|uniref:glycosyltransferase family 4 protein n=1 Tax=Zunongwangia sp. HRR-M8 TaxID=3015170 RepID=UPI0022DDE443|nr:glycosyltransferase family 4 protein [Zunongwangia sp. HRR-M8]WBL23200.1 glycosyltransferase family 4 protein [Zunongwangia sp. HRR-M8]